MRPFPLKSGRSVVVTGAGHGLGREIALGFAKRRFIVFGTAGSAQEVQDLRGASGGRVSLVVCDTRQTEMVNTWACGVIDAIGASGLDVLINTTVHLPMAPLELLPLEEVRQKFETNVFGGIAVINAFLPALRMAHGRVVQISSRTMDVLLPFDGPSSASQAAMEAFSAAYRSELEPFGVDVIVTSVSDLARATANATEVLSQFYDGLTLNERKLYGKRLRDFKKRLAAAESTDDQLTAAARVLELALQDPTATQTAVSRAT